MELSVAAGMVDAALNAVCDRGANPEVEPMTSAKKVRRAKVYCFIVVIFQSS